MEGGNDSTPLSPLLLSLRTSLSVFAVVNGFDVVMLPEELAMISYHLCSSSILQLRDVRYRVVRVRTYKHTYLAMYIRHFTQGMGSYVGALIRLFRLTTSAYRMCIYLHVYMVMLAFDTVELQDFDIM